MAEISPVSKKTSRRSRYSLYQSDYETAGEESDNSLYYSVLDDEDNETVNKNKENSINGSNVVKSTRRSLFAKCLQNQLNQTPRNEFNKRALINSSLQSTSSPAMSNEITVPAGSSIIPSIDNLQGSLVKIESHKKVCYSMTSLQLEKATSIENAAQMVNFKTNASNDLATNVASDIIINDDNDQSLNNTVIAIPDNQTGSTIESTTQAAATEIHNDTSTANSNGM